MPSDVIDSDSPISKEDYNITRKVFAEKQENSAEMEPTWFIFETKRFTVDRTVDYAETNN